MGESSIIALFSALLGISVTGNAIIWFRLGALTKAIKSMCPFGQCPMFKRAQEEAAPMRKEEG